MSSPKRFKCDNENCDVFCKTRRGMSRHFQTHQECRKINYNIEDDAYQMFINQEEHEKSSIQNSNVQPLWDYQQIDDHLHPILLEEEQQKYFEIEKSLNKYSKKEKLFNSSFLTMMEYLKITKKQKKQLI